MRVFKTFGLRTWSTPLTIGSFMLMAVTGVLMFFDVVLGYISFVHEWFSWLFLLGAGGHIAVNFRPLVKHLQSGWGRTSVAVFAAILLVSSCSFGRITAPQLKCAVSNALVDAPLTALAGVKRTGIEDVLGKLKAHGISATPDQNVRELAVRHGLDEFHVLGLVFLGE